MSIEPFMEGESMTTTAQAIRAYVDSAGGRVTAEDSDAPAAAQRER